MWADEDEELFPVTPQRPFTVGEHVVVDTVLGLRPAVIEWIGRLEGYPAMRVASQGGTYTISAGRVRHLEETDDLSS